MTMPKHLDFELLERTYASMTKKERKAIHDRFVLPPMMERLHDTYNSFAADYPKAAWDPKQAEYDAALGDIAGKLNTLFYLVHKQINQIKIVNPQLFVKILACTHHAAKGENSHYQQFRLAGEIFQPTALNQAGWSPVLAAKFLEDFMKGLERRADLDYVQTLQQVLFKDFYGSSGEIRKSLHKLEQNHPSALLAKDATIRGLEQEHNQNQSSVNNAQRIASDLHAHISQFSSFQKFLAAAMARIGSDYKNFNKLNQELVKAENKLAQEVKKLESGGRRLETTKTVFLRRAESEWEDSESDIYFLKKALPVVEKLEATQAAEARRIQAAHLAESTARAQLKHQSRRSKFLTQTIQGASMRGKGQFARMINPQLIAAARPRVQLTTGKQSFSNRLKHS
jgi:cell division protein FtsB